MTEPGPPAPPADRSLLDEAVQLARAAGDLTLRWFRTAGLQVETKADDTPVTAADRAAERHVREHLAAHHPDDGIIGEEEGTVVGRTARRWVVDPIDGTYGFVHGVPLYSTLLAVLDEAGPLVGVIHLPALGETVYAGRGLGCFCNGAPASVNDHATVDGAYLTSSGLSPWSDDELLRAKGAGFNLRTWGDGYGYVLVATGRIEAMVDPVAELYDLAPVPIIMSEAGGRFTCYAGVEDPGQGSGIATNGKIHDDVLALLAD